MRCSRIKPCASANAWAAAWPHRRRVEPGAACRQRGTFRSELAEEVALANSDPGMAQQRIGRGQVEEELRHGVVQEVFFAAEVALVRRAGMDGHLALLAALELRRRQRGKRVQGLGDERTQVSEG